MRPVRKTFPANLLIEGATALVVGGGRVGLRKTKALLEAGAAVRLVCPEAVADFDELPVERVTRCFVPDDVAGCRLVFACTDDKHTNRAVLAAARAKGVACCCADGNWAEGDFIVPATLRMEGLTLAVSTDGRSCRTAKEVREGLARSLARVSPGVLYVLGVEEAAALPPIETLAARFAFLNGLRAHRLGRARAHRQRLARTRPAPARRPRRRRPRRDAPPDDGARGDARQDGRGVPHRGAGPRRLRGGSRAGLGL